MNTLHQNQTLTFSQMVFERLLLAYPQAHRDEYGAAMAQLFRDQGRDAWNEARHWGMLKLWLRVFPDLVKTSLIERLANFNPTKSMANKIGSLFSSPWAVFFKVSITVFILVVIASVVITFILPESYASTARIKVESDQPQSASAGDSVAYDPYFIQTTTEIMQSEVVLSKVIAALDLNTKWGKKYNNGEPFKSSETLQILQGCMILAPVRNTKLIDITVYSDDPKEAAQIANAIAEAYKNYRLQSNRELASFILKGFETQYQSEENQIKQTEAELNEMRQDYDISDDIYENWNFEQELAKCESLKNSNSTNELRYLVASLTVDPTLGSLLDKMHAAEQQYGALTNSSSPLAVGVNKAQAEVAAFNMQVDARVKALMVALKANVEAKQKALASTTGTLAKTKADGTKASLYWDKKRDLSKVIEIHQSLYAKIEAQKIDEQIPKDSMCVLIDSAEPNFVPVKPNKPLNIACGVIAGGFLGLISGTIAAVAVSALKNRQRKNPALA